MAAGIDERSEQCGGALFLPEPGFPLFAEAEVIQIVAARGAVGPASAANLHQNLALSRWRAR